MFENTVWMLAPMAAGLLVLASHVSLGQQVLTRGIVFIDLAIAQTAAVGVLVGESIGAGPIVQLLCATGFAVASALCVAGLSRAWPERREALIGLLYVGAASVTIFWISANAQGLQRVSSLLSGDVLWTTWAGMVPLIAATALYWLLRLLSPALMNRDAFFYPSFAVLVSLSVPLFGLYLVFVCLIVPALWAERSGRPIVSTIVASVVFVIGVLLSYWFDWPTGTTIVLAMISVSLPVLLLTTHKT